MFEQSTLRLEKADIRPLDASAEITCTECPCLVQYSGEDTGKRHVISKACTVIGRAAHADIYIDSPDIGRRHAELDNAEGMMIVRDLDSVNGVFLNGARVTTPTLLQDGDLIRLGTVVLKFFCRTNIEALLHDSMYRNATIDAGTNTFSKRYLLQTLEREVRRAHHGASPLSLLCLDLDHFKAVNDCFGHNAGDLVLRATASAVQTVLRVEDVFGRIGGEEFAVVLPNTPLSKATARAESVRSVVEQVEFELPSGEFAAERKNSAYRQTVSIGVAQLTGEMRDARSLLDAADVMLYTAKRRGRNCVGA